MTLRTRTIVVLLAALSACAPAFKPAKFPTSTSLFEASLERLQKKKWDDAVTGFEKLTLDLSSRDSLLPLAHFYLARARTGRAEHLLAAQEYTKLAESFGDDSLADDAMFESGKSYSRLWRRPALDPQYGQLAQVQYRLTLTLYPDSPRKGEAEARNIGPALRRRPKGGCSKSIKKPRAFRCSFAATSATVDHGAAGTPWRWSSCINAQQSKRAVNSWSIGTTSSGCSSR